MEWIGRSAWLQEPGWCPEDGLDRVLGGVRDTWSTSASTEYFARYLSVAAACDSHTTHSLCPICPDAQITPEAKDKVWLGLAGHPPS